MKLIQLINETQTEQTAYELFRSLGLVHEQSICDDCGSHMIIERGKLRHGINGRFRYSKRICRKSKSLFYDSLFNDSHLPISKSLQIIYLKGLKLENKGISREVNVSPNFMGEFIDYYMGKVDIFDNTTQLDRIG